MKSLCVNKIFISYFVFIMFTSGAAALAADDTFAPYIESYSMGNIDWHNGVIYGVGRGYLHLNRNSKMKALRAARVIAASNIVKIAAGVRLDDRRTLESFGKEKRTINVKALVRYKESRTIFYKYTDQPYYEVILEAPINGIEGLTSNVLDVLKTPPVSPKPLPGPVLPKTSDETTETWLVLDARNLPSGEKVNPALFPKIISENGETIYDRNLVDENVLIRKGMAEYVVTDKSREQIVADAGWLNLVIDKIEGLVFAKAVFAEEKKKRTKRRQFIVKDVQQVQGLAKTNLVVSESDAQKLKEEDAASKVLKECRVIVIASSPIGGIEGCNYDIQMAMNQ